MKLTKKIIAILISAVLLMALLTSCNTSGDTIVFNKKSIVNSSFDGIGIEWDVYENPYLVEGHWDTIINRVDNLSPSIVRCMLNMEWYMFIDLLNDNEIIYNFTGAHLKNLYKIWITAKKRVQRLRWAYGVILTGSLWKKQEA